MTPPQRKPTIPITSIPSDCLLPPDLEAKLPLIASLPPSVLSRSPTMRRMEKELLTWDGRLCIVCKTNPLMKSSIYCSMECGMNRAKELFESMMESKDIQSSLSKVSLGPPVPPPISPPMDKDKIQGKKNKTIAASVRSPSPTKRGTPPPSPPSADKNYFMRSKATRSPKSSRERSLTPLELVQISIVRNRQSRIRELEAMLKRLRDIGDMAVHTRQELKKKVCLFPYELFDENMEVILSDDEDASDTDEGSGDEREERVIADVNAAVARVRIDTQDETRKSRQTLGSSVCMVDGRCPKHDDWIATKTKDLKLQIEEETRTLKEDLYEIMQSRLQKSMEPHPFSH